MSDGRTVAGTAVALNGAAVWIKGASGAGKSLLALDLIARGCVLIADDRVLIGKDEDGPVLSAPPAIRGLIEARGIGLLKTEPAPHPVPLKWVVDLDARPDTRLPTQKQVVVQDHSIPYIAGRGLSGLAAVVMLLLSDRAHLLDPDAVDQG